MEAECLVKDGEKGSTRNPLTLDELGEYLSNATGQDVKIRGFIPPKSEVNNGLVKSS